MKPDGSEPLNVTNTAWSEYQYSWSPDGAWIALTNNRDGDQYSAIYLLDARVAGDLEVRLVEPGRWVTGGRNSTRAYPSWLPDSRRLGFCYAAGSAAFVIDTGSGGVETLAWEGWFPTWSPDGSQIAYLSNDSAATEGGMDALWLRDDVGGNARYLTKGVRWERPAWSPDGKQVAFINGAKMAVYAVNADGSDLRRVARLPGPQSAPCWSPDGRQITYASGLDGNQEIYTMGADGSNPVNLTRHRASDRLPCWVYWGDRPYP